MSEIDWGKGKYEPTAADLLPAARQLVDAARIKPGEHVVDVGAGTGNVALLAADLGARVTAVEPAARLREVIEETAAGRDLVVVDGTAESIPLTDGSADVILSNFAVIFAADPAAAIAELSRVAAPSSRILLTSWLPGVMGKLVGIVVGAVRELSDGRNPAAGAIDWHDPKALSELFGPHGYEVSATTLELGIVTASAEEYWETRIANHPLGVATFPLLQQAGRLDEIRARFLEALTSDHADPSGEIHIPAQYLLATATR
ncbi:class I SAM-dependent methyltransferase [Kribbella kalugense]|uniref:Ubiquinone/menaquinone biosynthesis C-methylase UbiE n=1 Tax=Kribbella kalugense TaxID=2512221 RepID=A0A4R7ZV46_9ACTN|nr:class I SAM-dependent methyltransferase [Kribbella kalugense]TDW19470.1 ubiquinone/menaquinone biosynthesis C-methylase UbiE [Kribbella kalugense]